MNRTQQQRSDQGTVKRQHNGQVINKVLISAIYIVVKQKYSECTRAHKIVLMNNQQRSNAEDECFLKDSTIHNQKQVAMQSVATITDIKGLAHSHAPEFSRRHPAIPKRYVLPWKQDMVNRKLIIQHAALAGVYRGPQEESLFLENKERLCHGEEYQFIMEKMKTPSEKQITDIPMHSPLSRYKSYIINQKSRML
ncbi:sperm-associated microtubule inner protein 10 [Pseudophryne corroboree]|uniref:sperm-associated microtubule inner protein 10 n=1 Tax=Pseudophryne corroboree TaxID=495146 RepID=UPI00308122DF